MKFQILIPTYNRSGDLKANLEQLRSQLLKYRLTQTMAIAVSDNASTDDTWPMLQELKDRWGNEFTFDILRNETNVGLEQNTVNLLLFATAEYIIWLGDDDFLPEDYLPFVAEQCSGDQTGWIIPGLVEVDKNGNKHIGRPVEFTYKQFPAGYQTVYERSHLAHQMSGLVVKREGLATAYLSRPEWRNPYLFIFFTTFCQLKYGGVYAPSYQVLVNNFNPKDWGYNKIGLLNEVFKSYYFLQEMIGQKGLNKVLLRFIVMHSYRLNFKRGLRYVLKQARWITESVPSAKGLRASLYQLVMKEYLVRKFRDV